MKLMYEAFQSGGIVHVRFNQGLYGSRGICSVLSDTIFDNQLMRDGKFNEISELANLATLEALQFTK